ncbi:hypothetical protein N9204_00355 [bacterium]|nr:hypothetical protein [bacterium]
MIEHPETTINPNRTYITLSTLSVIVAVLFSSFLTFSKLQSRYERLETTVSQNTENITTLKVSVVSIQGDLNSISKQLESILSNQRYDTLLDTIRYNDRWSTKMEDELQSVTYEVLKQYIPELKRSEMPDVREIQKRFLEGRITAPVNH